MRYENPAASSFAVLLWIERSQTWTIAKSGLGSYAAANRWCYQFQTRQMIACVRREPVVFPPAPQQVAA